MPSPVDFATFSKFILPLPLLGLLSCSHALYYAEQGLRYGAIVQRAEPIPELLASQKLDEVTRQRLLVANEAVDYAERVLKMRTAGAYRHYSDLGRSWLTQVLVAAYPDRLERYMFRYPFMGELPYRGFFREDAAKAYARHLEQSKGLEVDIREVAAFSSLGWARDPLLNTMIDSESGMIDLIFHELVHVNYYPKGHTDFNEALATWFALSVSKDFVKVSEHVLDRELVLEEFAKRDLRQRQLTEALIEILEYGHNYYAKPGSDPKIFKEWMNQTWRKHGFERIAQENWNHARLLSASTYYRLVPRIEELAAEQELSAVALLAKLKSGQLTPENLKVPPDFW